METIVKHTEDIETREMGTYTKSFGLSFAAASLFNALLVIVKEGNEDTVLAWMAAATGHHWVTQGVLDLIVFFGLGWILSRMNDGEGVSITGRALVATIVASLVISWLIIVGFFLIE
jgi:hypothetical protein